MTLLKNKIFVISTGYVEDASCGSLLVRTDQEFASTSEALYCLGKDIYDYYEELRLSINERVEEYEQKGMRDCCIASKNLGSYMCAKCWEHCKKNEKKTTPEFVVDSLFKYMGLTNDQAGYDFYEGMGERGWDFSSSLPRENFSMIIVNNYCWHPNFIKYGNLGAEWQEWVVSPNNPVGWKTNNPSNLYKQTDLEDEDD